MKDVHLLDLQESVQDRAAFTHIDDYYKICTAFLDYFQKAQLTRIVSPAQPNYVFYQYGSVNGHVITRPLNSDLFIEVIDEFAVAYERFMSFLDDLAIYQEKIVDRKGVRKYIATNEINKVIYTLQQSIGSIGDSFSASNQARKRIGQLFERLIALIIQKVGLECESRTINLPIPEYDGYTMSYELDVVFSRHKIVVASEAKYIHPSEVVGSIKTTSKDRIDKIFLDKYLLRKLLGRDVPVVAIFLHDVQRARRGHSIFGINSTFKTNHFLGYTVALTKLDGVYYVDPRPEMMVNDRLKEQIKSFQFFLTDDLWNLIGR